MRQSLLFTKTRREDPADETAKNAKLLIRAGFIHKEMAGVYAYLPLGWRTLNNICQIIREEMDAVGGLEIQMTALQEKEKWEKSNRWDDEVVDVWFKTKLKNDSEVGLGFTHDEALISILKNHLSSYKDLPLYAYQIQTKFRNELRAKSGIMRGREFLMKDFYSFHASQAEQDVFYEKMKQAYANVFSRCGIGDKTYFTFSSGGTFSQFSHEFQTVAEAGEDIIYVAEERKLAINKEVYTDEVLADLGIQRSELVEKKGVEVGNIFKQGTKFTDALDLYYLDHDGKKQPLFMAGYGIGVSRLMGTIVEVLADDGGMVWPATIAPFAVHIVSLGNTEAVRAEAARLYEFLQGKGVEVLYDDRDLSAGEKLADADLLGMPLKVVVSEKTIAGGKFETKVRHNGEVSFQTAEEIVASLDC